MPGVLDVFVRVAYIMPVEDALMVTAMMITEQKQIRMIKRIQKGHPGRSGVIGISQENRHIGAGEELLIQ